MLGATYSVTLEDVEAALGEGFTHIRFYRATTETATLVQVYSTSLAAGTLTYTYSDPAAQPTDWWTWALWGSSPGLSDYAERQPVATIRITRRDLRRNVGYRLGLMELATVASATTTSATCSELQDPDRSVHEIASGWVYLPSGETRRIRAGTNGYNPATGQVTWAPAATAPSAGDEVEIWSGIIKADIVGVVHRAMRVARFALMYPDYLLIETAGNEDTYPLPYNAIHSGVLEVEQNSGGYWVPYRDWDVQRAGQQAFIVLRKSWPNTVYRITYASVPDALDDDSDSWDVPVELATAEVAKQVMHSLLVPSSHREMLGDIAVAVKALDEEAARLRSVYLPEIRVPTIRAR